MSSIIMAANAVSNGMAVFKPLYWLFGKCMAFLLDILNNQYFIALIIFTVVTRLILLPLNVKQQKSMAGTTRLQPKIQKINKKYPDPRDRDKLNQEMQDLYAREGHNPMQMGCGPMIFQMIFLMGVIGIIYYPIQYVLGASGFNDASNEIYKVILPIYQQITGNADAKITYFQLNILENFPAYKEALMQSFPKIFTSTVCSDIETYRQGMTMFGLDMTRIPHWKDGIIVIIPILSLVTSLGSSFVSTIIQKKNNPAAGQQATQMMMMMLMMPFFSFYIAFKVTAAVGFYWTISNVIAIFQQLYIYKVHPPKKTQAKLMVENTIERRSREENIKKMIKEFIGTGKTIEEATQNAKLQLNAPETADVHVEIITMPEKKKFFGLIGGCDAKVKVSYDDGKKEKKPEAPKKSVEKKASAPKKPAQKKQEVKEKPVQAPKADKPEEKISEKDIDLDYACAYLKTMIEGLKVENPKITAKVADGTVEMNIECEDYGIIIGRRGETLDSLQYLTSLAIKNVTNKYVRVTLNVGDYRAKREETLKALATKNANYVARSGRRYSFEPMNPYERRIIHTAVQEIEGVTSRSIGSGMDRRVLIEPEGGVKHPYRNDRRGGRRPASPKAPVDANREKKVDRADIPKFGKIQVNKDND